MNILIIIRRACNTVRDYFWTWEPVSSLSCDIFLLMLNISVRIS